MNCEDADITFAFIGTDNDLDNPIVEIRPLTMDFQRNRNQFDFARAKFSKGVAEHIESAVHDEDGALHRPRPVVVKLGGLPVHRMLYLPDAIHFGSNNVHIELHDCQKYLDRGVVDYQRQNVRLEDAYRYVFGQRDTSDGEMFSGIDFSVPESAFEQLDSRMKPGLGPIDLKNRKTWRLIEEQERTDEHTVRHQEDVIRDLEAENIHNIIDGHYALDFEQVSPWEAILEMNEKFGVTTWVAPDGKFWVGSRDATGIDHIAAPDDPRVWRLVDYNITPPRDPIMKVVVRGKQVHDPNDSLVNNIGEFVNQDRNILDFRMEGVAERPDIDFGRIIEPEDLEAAADGLKEVADRKLRNEQKKQWSGNLELLPSHSGSVWTDIRDVQIGDSIVTVPPENNSGECKSSVRLERFWITGVQHKLSEDGEWSLRLNVVPVEDGHLHPDNIKVYNRYFDPTSGDYVDEETYEARKKENKGFQLNDII